MDRRTFLISSSAGVTRVSAISTPVVLASQRSSWQSDGAGRLAQLGVLTPEFDPVPESEISAMAPPGVSIHGSRVRRNRTAGAFAEAPHVDTATELLAELAPKAIIYAYTSSSYALGTQGDDAVRKRLEERSRGIPVIMTCPAAVDGLRTLGAQRVGLIHPPWFSEELIAKGQEYFRKAGFEVLLCTGITPPRAFSEVPPAEVFEFVRGKTPRQVDAVFIAGNGLRAVGTIQALEMALRKPVLTANQVVLWAALRVARAPMSKLEYGRLFRQV